MRKARDYRYQARRALAGFAGQAVGVGILASVLGGTGLSVTSTAGSTAGTELGLQEAMAVGTMMRLSTMIGIAAAVVSLIIGGVVNMGYCRYNLRLIDRRETPRVSMLFDDFYRIPAGIAMVLLQMIFVLLWALPGIAVCFGATYLLMEHASGMAAGLNYEEAVMMFTAVVLPILLIATLPALVASYRYSLMPYLMAENPELRAIDAMRESKRLMKGKKWKLFCLNFSFIGWDFLCLFTMGIGNLFLLPYRMAAQAAFVRDIVYVPTEEPQREAVVQLTDGVDWE